MKRLFYGAFALSALFAISCTKEAEAPVATEERAVGSRTCTLQATISGEETRTAYTDFKKFTWLSGDKISVLTYNEETEYYRISQFTAQADGVTTDFTGEIEDGYVPGALAVYPDNASFVNSNIAVYLPPFIYMDDPSGEYYYATGDNPLMNMTLVGTVNDEGTAYAFKTAVGAIKLSFSNLPAEARYLRIYDPYEKIAGYFHIDENRCLSNESAVPGTYTFTDSEGTEHQQNYSSYNIWYHFEPDAEGNATLYIPLPVGKLSAGTTFYIENEDEEVLFEKQSRKDIVIERNKVTELATLKTAHEWVSLGTGRFIDNYVWNLHSFTSGQFVEVEIFKDSADPSVYRVASPYGAAATAFAYKKPRTAGTPRGPEDLYLRIGADGRVSFQTPHNTGLFHPSYTNNLWKAIETQLVHPASGYLGEFEASHNTVITTQASGIPGQVQLAPIYWWLVNPSKGTGNWSGGDGTYLQNNLVRIIFPGADDTVYDLDAQVSFVEIVDDTPSAPIALVSTYLGIDLDGGKLVIAASRADAEAAFASGTGVTEITSSGEYEVAFPADAPSGEYTVYLKTSPVETLAESAGMMYTSTPFKYYSEADDRQLELSSILGTWENKSVDMFFNPTLWDEDEENDDREAYAWQDTPYSVTFTFAESDDEELGNVMLVAFEETGVGFCGVETPVYGTFDSKHGTLTFPAAQPIYSFTQEGRTYGIVFEDYFNETHDRQPLVFELSEDLQSLSVNYEYFTYSYWDLDNDQFFGYSNIVMDLSSLTKATAVSSAPRRKAGLRTVKAFKPRMEDSVEIPVLRK